MAVSFVNLIGLKQAAKRLGKALRVGVRTGMRRIPMGGGLTLYSFWLASRETGWLRELPLRASAVAFAFFLAVAPALILVFSLAPYIPLPNLDEEIRRLLSTFLPQNAYNLIQATVVEALAVPNTTRLSLTLLSVVLLTVRGLRILQRALHFSHEAVPAVSFQQGLRLVAIFLLLVLLVVLAVGLLTLSELVLYATSQQLPFAKPFQGYLGVVVAYVLEYFTLAVGVALIYQLPRKAGRSQSWFTPGVYLAAGVLLGSQFVLREYVSALGRYNAIYGSLFTVIVLLLWFYVISYVLLLGMVLNRLRLWARVGVSAPLSVPKPDSSAQLDPEL